MIHLVLGGARSGKSRFSEQWIINQFADASRYYLATAQAYDDEMIERIEKHQQDRLSQHWQLCESPIHIDHVLQKLPDNSVVLIDCLTLWLTNILMSVESKENTRQKKTQLLSQAIEQLILALSAHQSRLTMVAVANEVGLGVVPMGEQSRLFVDHAGWLNQKVAKIADQVTLVTAGIPLTLKGAVSG
ncbi:bifunctional adenosylcobinamide kinase/adenosylcobinamide-phosphate guanylyltransferase [Thalassotalea sp. 1_MG-2023]|uniref:bifunctional adenosylcobinamide kinase/adenosylcobinamide-phosphate guanylyltransferase n=1 Tax=Thalassotalea sp. 1_MG-2023 TaxID=3062680 RepID=UPI0026E45227|nr:bifunctional adenosylcobinamide kinase/adenosylcobinamide-phosphate guanylyltransferase [Thalassotalea sp. 1_MG-2023]MDO6427018.1 bifunctional adenosylcobinamide kinase/adenosylcobinamide-phosphate guanylyltransferase [Thalassotalea sp. 1_MG-2023]